MKEACTVAVAAALLLVGMAACSIVPDSEPAELLDPRLPAPSPAAQSAGWALQIARPDSDPTRDSARLMVRTVQGQLQVHASARWIAPAPELLRTLLVRYLRDAQALRQVSAGAAGMDRMLSLDLRRFELAEAVAGGLRAEARIEARLYDTITGDLIARRLFEGQRTVDTAQAAAILDGFEGLLGEIIPGLAAWIINQGEQGSSEAP